MERFWNKVDKTNDCWLWTGYQNKKGYGMFRVGDTMMLTHRYSAQAAGMIIDNMLVCHHCDNPSCVRPDHLFLGNHIDNMRDKVSKGRGKKFDKRKLTEQQIIYIRSSNDGIKELAQLYNVGKSTIWYVKHNQTYKEIK